MARLSAGQFDGLSRLTGFSASDNLPEALCDYYLINFPDLTCQPIHGLCGHMLCQMRTDALPDALTDALPDALPGQNHSPGFLAQMRTSVVLALVPSAYRGCQRKHLQC